MDLLANEQADANVVLSSTESWEGQGLEVCSISRSMVHVENLLLANVSERGLGMRLLMVFVCISRQTEKWMIFCMMIN